MDYFVEIADNFSTAMSHICWQNPRIFRSHSFFFTYLLPVVKIFGK